MGVKIQLALQLLTVKPDRHRPSIQQLNLHICAKHTTFYFQPIGSNRIFKSFNQWLGDGRRSGSDKAWTPPPAHISIERKLGDNQHFSSNIQKRAVHLALIVAKDAQ